MRDLEALRAAAMETGAFAPALRAIELQGRQIGLWQTEQQPGDNLLEEIVKLSRQLEPDDK
jgi:hypothetical protein